MTARNPHLQKAKGRLAQIPDIGDRVLLYEHNGGTIWCCIESCSLVSGACSGLVQIAAGTEKYVPDDKISFDRSQIVALHIAN